MKRELLIAIILTGLTAQAFAQPFVSMIPQPGGGGEKISGIEQIHGFHCRPMVGWDASVGHYRQHTHPGICANYQGCMKQQQRCSLILGRGWDVWKYERWGFDNWRYTNCMIEAGCY